MHSINIINAIVKENRKKLLSKTKQNVCQMKMTPLDSPFQKGQRLLTRWSAQSLHSTQ